MIMRIVCAAAATVGLATALAAQEPQEASPTAALAAALAAACRQNEDGFARYLTADNATLYRGLLKEQRTGLMSRFVLMSEPGRPDVRTDAQGRTVIRCEAAGVWVELRLGPERVRENLGFVRLETSETQRTEVGMVREGGGWRLLSLGVLLLNIGELAKRWEAADLEAREQSAINLLRRLREVVATYREAFGKLPETLAQLGPAPAEGISSEAANLVDAELAGGAKAGYRFRYRIVPPADATSEAGYELACAPVEYGKSGRRSFFLDSSGVLRGGDKQGAMATVADPRLEPRERY